MSNCLNALSSALLDATDVFLILTLFELGNGFLLFLTGKILSFCLVIRYAILVPSAVILYLAIATYIRGYSIWAKSFPMDEDSEQRIQKDIEELEKWDTPLLVLWGVASLLLVTYACFVSNKAKGKPLILDVSLFL